MFEHQHTKLATATDEIAEGLRALGVAVPSSYAQFDAPISVK
ncbi:MAG: DNA-binding ferritin-like protein [Gammaproteobacteria bacterium]|jgi:DNA-binding ferritin-like protein